MEPPLAVATGWPAVALAALNVVQVLALAYLAGSQKRTERRHTGQVRRRPERR